METPFSALQEIQDQKAYIITDKKEKKQIIYGAAGLFFYMLLYEQLIPI